MTNGIDTATEMRTLGSGGTSGGDGFRALLSIDQDTLLFTGIITRTPPATIDQLIKSGQTSEAEAAKAANRLLDLAKKLQAAGSQAKCSLQISLTLADGVVESSACQVIEDSRTRAHTVRDLLMRLVGHLKPISLPSSY